MREVKVSAGQRKRILWPFHSGFSRDVIFVAAAENGGPVSGTIEERARGMLGYSSTMHPLQTDNQFRIGMFKAGYSLFAIPDQDIMIHFRTGHIDVRDVMKWGAIAIGALFVFSQVMRVFGGWGS